MNNMGTPQHPSPWRIEAVALLALALPMIAGNVAWAGIAATDLLLIGRLGAQSVAAGALAINLFPGPAHIRHGPCHSSRAADRQ